MNMYTYSAIASVVISNLWRVEHLHQTNNLMLFISNLDIVTGIIQKHLLVNYLALNDRFIS